MTIQITPEGGIVIDGVKVGEWATGVLNKDSYVIELNGFAALIVCPNPNKTIQELINSGFTPQKWEE